MPKPTAVIADDHAMIRQGIRQMLSSAGIDVVAEAADGLEAIAQVRSHKPALLILDIAMPYARGIEVFGEARRWSPGTKIAVFSGMTSTGLLRELAEAGAEAALRDMAWGAGIAALFRAVPELEARGRVPLLDGRPEGVKALAERALARFRRGKAGQGGLPRKARAATFAFWQTEALLKLACADPARVGDGRLATSEFARRGKLLLVSMTGRL